MDWLVPWHPIEDEPGQVAAFEAELCRELAAGHPLHGLEVRAVARRQDCDDVLFALEDGSGRVAVVHLTWTRSPPERRSWPLTALYAHLESWAAEGMRVDHDEFHA